MSEPPVLTTKYISDNDTYYASDDGADGYSEVEVDVYPYTTYEYITENGYYEPYGGASSYYDIDVNVLPEPTKFKPGTTMDDIGKITCYDTIIQDGTANGILQLSSLNGWMVAAYGILSPWGGDPVKPDDMGYICGFGIYQRGNYTHAPYFETLRWSYNPSTGIITGEVDFPPFGYNQRGTYLGDRAWVTGSMSVILDNNMYYDGQFYNYPEHTPQHAVFSGHTYWEEYDFLDSSHDLYII